MEDKKYELLTARDSNSVPEHIKELLEKEDISKIKYINNKSQNKKYEPRLSVDDILEIVKWLITLDEETISNNNQLKLLIKKIDGYFYVSLSM